MVTKKRNVSKVGSTLSGKDFIPISPNFNLYLLRKMLVHFFGHSNWVIQNCCFSSSVKTNHQNSHFYKHRLEVIRRTLWGLSYLFCRIGQTIASRLWKLIFDHRETKKKNYGKNLIAQDWRLVKKTYLTTPSRNKRINSNVWWEERCIEFSPHEWVGMFL